MNDELRHALAQVLRLLETVDTPPASEPEPEWAQYELTAVDEPKATRRTYKMDRSAPKYNQPWTQDEYEAALILKEAGWSNNRIGSFLGRSPLAIRKLNVIGTRGSLKEMRH